MRRAMDGLRLIASQSSPREEGMPAPISDAPKPRADRDGGKNITESMLDEKASGRGKGCMSDAEVIGLHDADSLCTALLSVA
eukprot:CAMPEP_0170584654 /NCGR_PEP_ID=MMETSP0224-20130122/8798_1 /TAXON_ID=285029 /ORGANISM="Togula jolla, Strain CCCM 725" /LENGTH=81 /DNA_ID=CAMNT_0010908091 /DNA_START=142 /DNA_END=388 /DNA_ORIENTATION=-